MPRHSTRYAYGKNTEHYTRTQRITTSHFIFILSLYVSTTNADRQDIRRLTVLQSLVGETIIKCEQKEQPLTAQPNNAKSDAVVDRGRAEAAVREIYVWTTSTVAAAASDDDKLNTATITARKKRRQSGG